jgi:hypothetical protein
MLSRARLREARLLLRNGEYSGAYYLSGLAVECALKSCIARQTGRFDFPNKTHASNSYSHDLVFEERWGIALGWKVSCRYETIDQDRARRLYEALTARSDGVLGWIRCHW